MSTKNNFAYAESVIEDLQQACIAHDYDEAERIAVATKRSGFPRLSDEMFALIEQSQEEYTAEMGEDQHNPD